MKRPVAIRIRFLYFLYFIQTSLAYQTIRINQILEEIYFGGNWLKQMDDSARKFNMSIQYGMAYPRHVLQTLESQAVTQVIVI